MLLRQQPREVLRQRPIAKLRRIRLKIRLHAPRRREFMLKFVRVFAGRARCLVSVFHHHAPPYFPYIHLSNIRWHLIVFEQESKFPASSTQSCDFIQIIRIWIKIFHFHRLCRNFILFLENLLYEKVL